MHVINFFIQESSNSRSNASTYFPVDVGVFSYWDENLEDLHRVLEVDNVRITPPVMLFSDAFEGRKYKQKLVIQNCGKSPAFVRICPSTSSGFKIDTIVRGQHLSAGLSITRIISYTYMRASVVRLATFPIHINDKRLDYRMVVTLSSSIITAEPKHLDFGTVDAGHSAAMRTLLLKNDGTKAARFAIDLGDNKLDLIVYPLKGLIQAKSEVTLCVEAKSPVEGVFLQEFWIKTEPPLRIQVAVTFILPKLTICCCRANTCSDFTIIDFKRVYFGTHLIKPIILRNESALDAMFCIMAEVQKNDMLIRDAVNVVPDFKCFEFSTLDGRLTAHENGIIEVTFTPKMFPKSKALDSHDDYAIGVIRIMRVSCKDLDGTLDEEAGEDTIKENSGTIMNKERSITSLSISMDGQISYPSLEYLQLQSEVPNIVLNTGVQRVLCHGIFEHACVKARPDAFNIQHMTINKVETRELTLTNNSAYLPIIFKYKKVANIEIKPKKGLLRPLESTEVDVKITPSKYGINKTAIVFDLLYTHLPKEETTYVSVGHSIISVVFNVVAESSSPKPKFNMEIIPEITHNVPYLVKDKVNLNVVPSSGMSKNIITNKKKKEHQSKESRLLALKNHNEKTFKPWRKLSKYEQLHSSHGAGFSDQSFLLGKPSLGITSSHEEYTRKNLSDYNVTKTKHVLMEPPLPKTFVTEEEHVKQQHPSFIPLTPTQLYEIKITPMHVDLGRIAMRTYITDNFTLQNNNNFSLRIILRSQQKHIAFPNGDRKVINGSEETQINFTYFGYEIGKHNLKIGVIINESHCFEVAIDVDVVVKSVKVSTQEITFISNEELVKFVDLTNSLNTSIFFMWDTPKSCFAVEPISGYIRANCTISCMVTYFPHLLLPTVTEFTVLIQNGSKEPLKISVLLEKPLVTFQPNQFVIEHIPLNIPGTRKFLLKNIGYEPVSFYVSNPEPLKGIRIAPAKGTFRGRSDQVFTIYLCLKACVKFKCLFKVELQRVSTIEFEVIGSVDYPDVIIQPELVKFRKLVLFAFDRIAFLLQNRSQLETYVKFNFEYYSDYFVSEFSDVNYSLPMEELILDPEESRQLFLHFKPIDVASYKLLLPIIINNILGPPNLNNPNSLDTSTYLSENLKEYVEAIGAVPVDIPKTMPIVKIETYVSNTFLKFSTYGFEFAYFPNEHFVSTTQQELIITNIKNEIIEFCIRTGDLTRPFAFTYVDGKTVERYECSIICRLQPMQHVVFEAKFFSKVPGKFSAKLPIYVRHYLDGAPFNYLSFNGTFPPATLETSEKCYYFEPIPVCCKSVLCFKLTAAYHVSDCFISYIIDSYDISVNFPNGNKIDTNDLVSDFYITLTHFSKTAKTFETSLTFTCSCSFSLCKVNLKGASENCLLTTHASLKSKEVESEMNKMQGFGLNSVKAIEAKSLVVILGFDESDSESTATSKLVSMTNFNTTTFPLFPDDEDTSEFAIHMRNCLAAVENWVYEQGFQGRNFYKIPEGIAALPVTYGSQNENTNKGKNSAPDITLTFIKLLMNLAGSEIKTYVIPRAMPECKLDKVSYIYSIYNAVLVLLKSKNALLPHVKPEYLLEYEDYKTYMKYVYPIQEEDDEGNAIDERLFTLYSKQSWMDLILQTYKLFVLSRVRLPLKVKTLSTSNLFDPSKTSIQLNIAGRNPLISAHSQTFLRVYENVVIPPQNIYSKPEMMLLFWLEYNFNQQRDILWSTPLKSRNIKYFDKDLKDSIVLAALTAAYCPYLVPYLKDFYLDPDTYEQLFHNAVQLIKAWNRIECSFSLFPSQIVQPNVIQMILLVNYLYDFFPGLYPDETIEFKVPHTQTAEKSICIENNSDCSIAYKVVLFNNDKNLFEVSPMFLHIAPQQEKTLQIKFHAKQLACLKTFLVLCGDVRGYYFSKSMAFRLEGIPDITYITDEITFRVQLYQVFDSSFFIHSPYKVEATYNIHFINKRSDNVDTLMHMPWSEVKHYKLPRRIYNLRTTQICDETGSGVCTAILCPLVPKPKDVILYFINADIGDFSLKCNFECDWNVQKTHHEILNVTLTRDFDKQICDCKKIPHKIVIPNKCPKRLLIKIPHRNNLLWKCVEEMIMSTIDPFEVPVWSKYLGTTTGLHMMHHIFQTEYKLATKDITHIYRKKVLYKVIPVENPTPSAVLPETIAIDNVFLDGNFEVPIHVEADKPNDFFFILESEDERELRFYKIAFVDGP